MSFASLLVETVTIRTPAVGVKDGYGRPTLTWTTTTAPARVDQLTTVENTDDRDTVVSRFVLFLTPDVVIASDCQVERADGSLYAVDGNPNVVYGRVAPHHLEVPLRQVTG